MAITITEEPRDLPSNVRHVGTWGHRDRSVSVQIETLEGCEPGICVTFDDACSTRDDLSAAQARTRGAFLKVALSEAALRLDEMAGAQA